jgi:hypothetical protein
MKFGMFVDYKYASSVYMLSSEMFLYAYYKPYFIDMYKVKVMLGE